MSALSGRTAGAVSKEAADLGGTTMHPGIYVSSTTLAISSADLTLDALGDASATFVFKMVCFVLRIDTQGPHPFRFSCLDFLPVLTRFGIAHTSS